MPAPISDSASSLHKILDTPVPNEYALLVSIDEGVIIKNPDIIPAVGTAYNAFPNHVLPNDYLLKFGTYQFASSDKGTDGRVHLIFSKGKTEAQKNTPFRTVQKFGNHYWHPVLKGIEIIPDDKTPRAYRGGGGVDQTTYAGPSFYVRTDYIPGVNEGSMFVIEEFFAATKFSIGQYPTPQPSAVSYDLPGVSGGFPECLHNDITIEDHTTTNSMQVVGAGGQSGMSTQVGSGIRGQFFPRTNFTTWAPYVLSDEQQQTPVGFHRTRVTVYPPSIPKLSIK